MAFSRKLLIMTLAVAGFDVVTSVLSKNFRYEYSKLIWTSFLIYLVAGYLGGRRRGIKCGMLLGSLAGFIDSTIGWFILRMIGPFTEMTIPTLTLPTIVMVVVTTTTIGFVFGMIGACLWKALWQRKPVAGG
jgi:hypothetical protein